MPLPSTSRPERPLDIRVIDLTRNLAGPFCTMMLADFGADVIKVERPGTGDDTRAWQPPAWNGHSATYLSANRNKRSIAIDIDTTEGQTLVRRLAHSADVLVESFRPGSLLSRGLDAQTLIQANPRLIYCSISAYGQDGPKSQRPGYDPVLQAATGIMDITGHPDQPAARLGIGAIDLGTALWATVGIQLALRERDRSGVGAHIQASLFETAAWWMSYHLTGYLGTGEQPRRQGTTTAFIAPYETFPTADGELFVAAANDGQFALLVRALGHPELVADPRFVTNPDRVRHRDQLRDVLVDALRIRSAHAWELALTEQGIACSALRTVADLACDPQLEHLGLLAEHPHPEIPGLRLVHAPIRVNGERAGEGAAPPSLGEHADDILDQLGVDEQDRVRWRASGILG